MSDADDKQFESYLKNFRPVDPELLPLHTKTHFASARGRSALAVSSVACLAAAALVLIVLSRNTEGVTETAIPLPGAGAPAFSARSTEKRIELPTIVLTKLALDDHRAFDEFMTDKTRSQFPSMNSEQSALRVLAKQ